MSVTILRDEWLKALTEATGYTMTDDPEAVTVLEFGAAFGLKRETARRKLEDMVKAKRAVRTQRRILAAGRMMPVAAYRLVKDGRGKRA